MDGLQRRFLESNSLLESNLNMGLDLIRSPARQLLLGLLAQVEVVTRIR